MKFLTLIIIVVLLPSYGQATCNGKALEARQAVELFGRTDLEVLPSGSLVLSNFDSNYGLVRLIAHKRECTLGFCTKWERVFLPAPGDVIRPELVIDNGELIIHLEKMCQGSYGHGTSCVFVGKNIRCNMIGGVPQCGGWASMTARLVFKGKITKSCIYLKHETESLKIELKSHF